MRIVCPTCSASYDVPDQRLTAGRLVRCARCNGEWTPVAPETPEALPQQEPPPPSPPSMEPEAPPETLPPPPPVPPQAEPVTIGPVRRSAMDRLAAHPASRRPLFGLRLAWAGSIVVLVLLIAMAFAWRSEIIALWPASARAYSALGLHSQPESSQ